MADELLSQPTNVIDSTAQVPDTGTVDISAMALEIMRTAESESASAELKTAIDEVAGEISTVTPGVYAISRSSGALNELAIREIIIPMIVERGVSLDVLSKVNGFVTTPLTITDIQSIYDEQIALMAANSLDIVPNITGVEDPIVDEPAVPAGASGSSVTGSSSSGVANG